MGVTSMPGADATVRLRLRVSVDAQVVIGPGKVALLEAVVETGSISAAARSLGMSYRRAWLLLDALNHALAEPALLSATGGQRGGGSTVTPAGRQLIRLYRQIEAEAAVACASPITQLLNLLADPAAAAPD